MKAGMACLICGFVKSIPKKKVPNNPPYVNDAIDKASSTTACELCINIMAEPTNKRVQTPVISLEI